MHGAARHVTYGGRTNKDWWPNQLNLKILHQHSALVNPMGTGFSYAEAFKKLDIEALVARRLRPLRPALHPHGLAQRRHLPHPGRPRRRQQRRPPLRARELLARQRQPR
jgi:hypothetical protein